MLSNLSKSKLKLISINMCTCNVNFMLIININYLKKRKKKTFTRLKKTNTHTWINYVVFLFKFKNAIVGLNFLYFWIIIKPQLVHKSKISQLTLFYIQIPYKPISHYPIYAHTHASISKTKTITTSPSL